MSTVDINDLLRRATQVRDASQPEENTAERVGTILIDLIRLCGFSLGDFAAQRYISKDRNDRTPFDLNVGGLFTAEGGAEFGEYSKGLRGAKVDADGNAEFGELLTRLKAILAQLQVNGDSEFRGRLSSEEFISGFIGGKGWAIFKREVLNALGVSETKYTGEFDDLIVRGTLRVFELVISQLLGENDNRVFTAMLEVDHYDPATGKVWLDTFDGRYYNPFRAGDYIMVQQYNGAPTEANGHYVTKHYECIIEDVGIGNTADGENRLDWVTIRNFTASTGEGPEKMIAKGDTFTRVDNATDPERKGLIGITTVGPKTPYIDIIYGLKTDPDNYLKGRLGNLEGIKHHLFGWLDGFGELLTNLYAVGDFRLRRTGESLDAKIEMLKAMFATRYSNLRYELTEDDNYLSNATFDETLAGWTVQDDGKVITSNGEALLMNGNTYIADGKIACIENLDGRNVLHLKKSSIRQANALIRKPGTHKEYAAQTGSDMADSWTEVKDKLYLSIRFFARTDGTLTIGMSGATSEPGSLPVPATVAVTASMEWQDLQWQGTWDGKGDFVLQYTGDMYVSILSITDRPLDDYRKEVSTQFIQTAGNIRLLGTNINNLRGTVTQLGIDLDAAEEQIRIYADKHDKLNGTVTQLGVRLNAAESNITLYADKLDKVNGNITNLGIRLDAAESNITLYADKLDNLNGTVTQLGIDLDAAEATLALHADHIDNINSDITKLGVRLNAAEGSITNYATRIGANETAISALQVKADSISSAVTGVQSDLDTAKSRIETVASIAATAGDAHVYNTQYNPWSYIWAGGEESKYVGAIWHNPSDGHTYRYIGYDGSNTWEDVTNQQSSASYILQNKDKISTVVGSFDAAGNLTNTSGLVTTAYASQIYATKSSVDELSGRVSSAEASINVQATQIAMRVAKDGIISAINQSAEEIKILASKITLEGYASINDSFESLPDGTTRIGGFRVTGNDLTNRNAQDKFENDASIIFRNDHYNTFAGIGGNVAAYSSGSRFVARFYNHDTTQVWQGNNYAMLVSAQGRQYNVALQFDGGAVSGLAMRNTLVTGSTTLTRGDYNVIAMNTSDCTITLPTMELHDDGHVIRIKRMGAGAVKIALSSCYTGDRSSPRYGRPYLVYNHDDVVTTTATSLFPSVCDAMEFVWVRDIERTISGTTYRGAWLQYKLPRDW